MSKSRIINGVKILRQLFKANILQSCIFNFKMLPFRDALHFPILLYGKVSLPKCSGIIVWTSGHRPITGAWRIGEHFYTDSFYGCRPYTTVLSIRGILELGGGGFINNGCMIEIGQNGKLAIGNQVLLNSNILIICEKSISIGDFSRLSWHSQIMDTDYHYVLRQDLAIHDKTTPIVIGRYCWIGNHCYLKKGTKLGDFSIVSAMSLLSKDFSTISFGIFAGIPANHIAYGRRVFSPLNEVSINEHFIQTTEPIPVYSMNNFIKDEDVSDFKEYLNKMYQ